MLSLLFKSEYTVHVFYLVVFRYLIIIVRVENEVGGVAKTLLDS